MEPINKKTKKGRKAVKDFEDLENEDNEEMEEEESIEITKKAQQYQNRMNPDQLEEDEEGDDPIQVDFLFLDPSQSQFFSVKSLVNGLLDGFSFKSSDLANLICDQVVVGTMIGVEGDEEVKPGEQNVLGFATILNLKANENQAVMKEVIQYVVGKSASFNENHDAFLNTLKNETEKIGLLVNERMLNLSPQLVPTLHNQVCEDVNWVQQQNNEDSEAFKLKYLLCLSKCYKEPKQATKRVKTGFEDFLYQKFEDYVFLQRALAKFTFQANSSKNVAGLSSLETAGEDQICERLIYLITYEDYQKAVDELTSHVEM